MLAGYTLRNNKMLKPKKTRDSPPPSPAIVQCFFFFTSGPSLVALNKPRKKLESVVVPESQLFNYFIFSI